MRPKNVMLLGFVNRAVEYINRNMDEEPDTRLAQIKNVDLESIKAELSDNLDSSLGTMQSTMSTLLKAGNEAFDEFLEDTIGKTTISQRIDRLFDVNFDSEEKKEDQGELAKLLSFYNLDEDENDSNQIYVNEHVDNTNKDDDAYLDEIRKNVTDDDIQEVSNIPKDDCDESKEIDSIFSEIVSNENNYLKGNKESDNFISPLNSNDNQNISDTSFNSITDNSKTEEAVTSSSNNSYINSMIDDLRERLLYEKRNDNIIQDNNKRMYDIISKRYSYLNDGLIKSIYKLKDDLNTDYNYDEKIIILHRTLFEDVDNLRRFAEICLNHGYAINADEKKMIVDVFKEFTNSEDKIISNIFEIANQGCLLNGKYEGYNVIVNEA